MLVDTQTGLLPAENLDFVENVTGRTKRALKSLLVSIDS